MNLFCLTAWRRERGGSWVGQEGDGVSRLPRQYPQPSRGADSSLMRTICVARRRFTKSPGVLPYVHQQFSAFDILYLDHTPFPQLPLSSTSYLGFISVCELKPKYFSSMLLRCAGRSMPPSCLWPLACSIYPRIPPTTFQSHRGRQVTVFQKSHVRSP